MKYPLGELEKISVEIQKLLGEYRSERNLSLDFSTPFEQRTRSLVAAGDTFMLTAGTEVLPRLIEVLAKIEALLEAEDEAIIERVKPILSEIQRRAQYPVNPLVYNDLSAHLMRLKGHLQVQIVISPLVFVGYRFNEDDEKIANKFMKLMELEKLEPISAEISKAEDIDDKVRKMIDDSNGVAIICTKEKELRDGGWTTSTWLIGEKGFAMGKDKEVILFFEDCIAESERKGIHGALEIIEFNRAQMDEAILKAIPYLRDFRKRILARVIE